jgi:hypothetical protein
MFAPNAPVAIGRFSIQRALEKPHLFVNGQLAFQHTVDLFALVLGFTIGMTCNGPGDELECPQWNSNPCCRLERPVS